MTDWIFVGILLVILSTIFYLLYLIIKYRTQRNNLYELGQYLNNELYASNLRRQELEKQIDQIGLKDSDGFIKFLSSSRDWAFDYIEQVQLALKEFDNVIIPIKEWNETYGTAIENDLFRHKIIEISSAYERLQSLLPKDEETPNN